MLEEVIEEEAEEDNLDDMFAIGNAEKKTRNVRNVMTTLGYYLLYLLPQLTHGFPETGDPRAHYDHAG